MKKVLGIVVILLLSFIGVLQHKYNKAKEELNIEIINGKAYQDQLEGIQQDNAQFEISMRTLRHFNDSISQKLVKTIDSLKIKDKRINSLVHQNIVLSKKDTVKLRDTIFKKDLQLDTIVGDKYISLDLKLRYPNTIIYQPTINLDLTTIISDTKEYVKPRKKYWIQRIFQKKHYVVRGKIIIDNPYVTTNQYRFIKIIK